jgi:hypothetical protein
MPPDGKPTAPKLSSSKRHRSKQVRNPLAGLSLRTARGRFINDMAAHLLASIPGHEANPLAVNDCVALAELRWRASELRRDPDCNVQVLFKLESLIERRTQRLSARYPKQDNALTVTDYRNPLP